MKITDVIRHTQKILPLFTDKFSSSLNVVSVTSVGTLVTVETEENHNLAEGDLIVMKGAMIPSNIASLTQLNGLGTLITEYDHDITKNIPLRKGDSTHITIEGANEPEFNGTFLIMDVPNSNVIEFSIDDTAPLVATGDNIVLQEKSVANYNGRQLVKDVLSDVLFTFELPYTPTSNSATGDISISTGIRITGAFSLAHANSAYTEQEDSALSGYVVFDGADVSKSKVNGTDAISSISKGVDTRIDLIQGVSFYVFIPTTSEYCWIDYVDLANDEIRSAICKTLHNAKFSNNLTDNVSYLSYVGDSPVDADGTAYMIYAYKFQTTMYMQNADGYEGEYTRALRHFELNEKPDFGTDDALEIISTGDLADEHISTD